MAAASRGLDSASGPPSLAATAISRTSLLTSWPFFCALASRPACFHCAPIAAVWDYLASVSMQSHPSSLVREEECREICGKSPPELLRPCGLPEFGPAQSYSP